MIRRSHSFFEPPVRRVSRKKMASKSEETFTAAEVCAILEDINSKLDKLIAMTNETRAIMAEMIEDFNRWERRRAKL